MSGVDIVALSQLRHDFGRAVSQALAGDHDEPAGRRFDRVTSLDIGSTVSADHLPIRAPGQDPATQLRPADGAAEDADHAALAIRSASEIGDGIKLGLNRENRLT